MSKAKYAHIYKTSHLNNSIQLPAPSCISSLTMYVWWFKKPDSLYCQMTIITVALRVQLLANCC